MPSSEARRFISATNASSLPATASPSTTAASLAEAITTDFIRSSARICSPSLRYICEPPIWDARVDVVSTVSSPSTPRSIASITRSSVIIFVTDAGGSASSAFFSYNTLPVDASMRIADAQSSPSSGAVLPDDAPAVTGNAAAVSMTAARRHEMQDMIFPILFFIKKDRSFH